MHLINSHLFMIIGFVTNTLMIHFRYACAKTVRYLVLLKYKLIDDNGSKVTSFFVTCYTSFSFLHETVIVAFFLFLGSTFIDDKWNKVVVVV